MWTIFEVIKDKPPKEVSLLFADDWDEANIQLTALSLCYIDRKFVLARTLRILHKFEFNY